MGFFEFMTELVKAKEAKKDSQIIIHTNTHTIVNGQMNHNKNRRNKNSQNKNSSNHRKTNHPSGGQKKTPANRAASSGNQKYTAPSGGAFQPGGSLTLQAVHLYGISARGREYTKTIQKSFNRSFGVEIVIKNSTAAPQKVKIGGCIKNSSGSLVLKWNPVYRELAPGHSYQQPFDVGDTHLTKMKEGNYVVHFWINDKKIWDESFAVV